MLCNNGNEFRPKETCRMANRWIISFLITLHAFHMLVRTPREIIRTWREKPQSNWVLEFYERDLSERVHVADETRQDECVPMGNSQAGESVWVMNEDSKLCFQHISVLAAIAQNSKVPTINPQRMSFDWDRLSSCNGGRLYPCRFAPIRPSLLPYAPPSTSWKYQTSIALTSEIPRAFPRQEPVMNDKNSTLHCFLTSNCTLDSFKLRLITYSLASSS